MNPFNPRSEYHKEQDPTIEKAMLSVAQRLEYGFTEDECLKDLVESRGLPPPVALNVVRAGALLFASRSEGTKGGTP